MVPLGLWNDMRLPSFFSGVFFWPVSESKRGKVRITFMFLSPPACHKLPFPSPVGRQLIRQQWASQPASDVSCERRTSFSPSLSLSLPVLLALLLPCCPSSASITLSSLSLFLLLLLLDAVRSNDSRCNRFTLPSSSCCLSQRGETTLTSIKATLRPTRAREEKRRMASARKQESAEARDGRGEQRGLKESVDRGEERV